MRRAACLEKGQEPLKSFERSNISSTSCRRIAGEENVILTVKAMKLRWTINEYTTLERGKDFY